MEFAFSEEQEAIRETAGRFATERLAPGYRAREKEGRLDRGLVLEMGELGLIGPDLPEEAGGLGVDGVSAGIIMEEIAAGDLNMAYAQLLGSLMGTIIHQHARPELARPITRDICAGKVICGLGLTEPQVGSDAANLALQVRRENDAYVLNGEKTSITLADQMDIMVVFARTGTAEERARGVSAFLLPMDTKGISTTRFDDMGEMSAGRGAVFFDEVRVPPENRLGQEGEGFRQVMGGFDYSRALIGLQCLGPARASLAESWAYTTEREAFGKPIAKYQGVTEPLAEAETLLMAATLLCYRTLWLRDQGQPHTAESAMCKWWAPKVAFDILHSCLLTHGHMGYTADLPHQQRMRDVLGLQIGDGTAQIQKMIIAREKIGRIAVPYE